MTFNWALGVLMIANSCIKIETSKFPAVHGEDEEIYNENMYGKALCQYLDKKFSEVGITSSGFWNEDWGWMQEVNNDEFSMYLCIYSSEFDASGDPNSYIIMPSEQNGEKWLWSKFRKVNISNDVLAIMDKISEIFKNGHEITNVSRHDDWPYYKSPPNK